jgi:hypothetical protein
MISPDLIVLLIIGGWTAIVAFFFYWKGYGAAQRELRVIEQELDYAIEAISAMSALKREAQRAESMRRHPAARPALAVIQGDLA